MNEHDNLVSSANAKLLIDLSTQFREPVRRYFFRRLRDAEKAEDLTQELFVRIVRKGDLENIEKPESFIFHAAANLLRDSYRRKRTARNFMKELTADSAENFEALSPERVLSSRQTLQSVLEVLNAMDPRMRDIFILHRIEGMKYAEIAHLYGLSVSSIEKYVVKCLANIAKFAPNPGIRL